MDNLDILAGLLMTSSYERYCDRRSRPVGDSLLRSDLSQHYLDSSRFTWVDVERSRETNHLVRQLFAFKPPHTCLKVRHSGCVYRISLCRWGVGYARARQLNSSS
ncbi:hypothetical protein AB6A40_001657 [Gnathostoma spinigerum]|uniref:Uncharacterized protein n=1 Tax=Gnathostoma spinigerum TaxID=75299 RepID=A0ABD6E4N3_9BILA